jgi:imidazolonepropionase-like amidohydrolase
MLGVRKAYIAILALLFVWPAAAQVASPPVLIKNVNVIDASGKVLENVSIEITNGKISAIGKDLEEKKGFMIVDKPGKWVIPGLIDLRVQLGASPANRASRAEVGEEQRIEWLHSLLKTGVTTARLVQSDLGEQTDLQRWRERALLNGPGILASGPTFTAEDGIPAMEYGPLAITTRLREVAEIKNEDDAMQKARDLAHNGGNVFEIVFTTGPEKAEIPRLNEQNLAVLTKEAHGHDLRTFCLVSFNEEAQKAIANGCDVLESMSQEVMSDELLKEMLAKNILFMPSMVSQGYLINHYIQPNDLRTFISEPLVEGALSPLIKQSLQADRGQIVRFREALPEATAATAAADDAAKTKAMLRHDLAEQESRAGQNIRRAKAAGVRMVTGTGAGGILNFPGPSEHIELELLVKNGLTPFEALQAATSNAAASVGKQEEKGTIAVGKDADLVILNDNPLQDIGNAAHIDSVVRFGWVINTADMTKY